MPSRRVLLWGAVLASLTLAVTSASAEGGFRRYARLRQDVERLRASRAALQEENLRLQREIRALQEDPRALERAVRERLGFVREGELVFTVDGP